MHVLEYREFTAHRNTAQYRKIVGFLEQNDFKSADVKKLAPTSSLIQRLPRHELLRLTVAKIEQMPSYDKGALFGR